MQRCDKNGDGEIGPDELLEMAKALKLDSLSLAQAHVLVTSMDTNGDGKITQDGRLNLECSVFYMFDFSCRIP